MLFWVTTRGRDRILSKPRDSAIVRIASMRTLLLAFRKVKPLVAWVTGRLENRGICVPAAPPEPPTVMYPGVSPLTCVGDVPAALAPPSAVWPLPQPKPN